MKGIRRIQWLCCLLIVFCIFMISNIPQAKGQGAEITFYWIASEGWNIRKNDVKVPLYIVETEWDQYDNVTYEIVKEYQTTLRYLKQVTMEGTGELNYLRHKSEGLLRKHRMINWGAPCKESATGLCFKTVDRTTHHWGRGSQGNPIIPWRSVAMAEDIVPFGTSIYIPALDGKIIDFSFNRYMYNWLIKKGYFEAIDEPYKIQLDGCFTVDDVGVDGQHIDIFAARKRLYKQVQDLESADYIIDDPRCTGIEVADFDEDGIPDEEDNCIEVANADQKDADGDGIGDACESDSDGDEVVDDIDNCIDIYNPEQLDDDADGIGNDCEADQDEDGIIDDIDNCLTDYNPNQADADSDGIGDICEADGDGDGVADDLDNCPLVYNPFQEDEDGDGIGTFCESDLDGDNVIDDIDNCPSLYNDDQADADSDGIGDACEPDTDADGVIDDIDNCLNIANADQADVDQDGTGDLCEPDSDLDGIIDDLDNCLDISNLDQLDLDKDGFGDLCDDDMDNDGVLNADDNCPELANESQIDTDGEGIGDACDEDIDGDDIVNVEDNCPLVYNTDQADRDNDGLGDACETDFDSDGDGFYDNQDNCVDVYNPEQLDLDGDGIGYACDSSIANYYDYCGDETEFDYENQVVVSAVAESATSHNLLPEIKINISSAINLATIVPQAVRGTVNGKNFAFVMDVQPNGSGAKLIFKNGVDGKRAWYPSSEYRFKLCHHVKTADGTPIAPTTIVVTTHKPNQQENTGLSHSNGSRTGVFYLPAGFNPEAEHPMILLLHGLGGNGAGMVSAYQSLADEMGVILIGPDGFKRTDPFNTAGTTYYFNPNHKNVQPDDYKFIMSTLNKMLGAFLVDRSKLMVLGMSMGVPATMFTGTRTGEFTHVALLHGVRFNFDNGNKNDVSNFLWYDWEITPIGSNKAPVWYSTSVDDWVTNYNGMSVPSFMQDDLGYLRGQGLNVFYKNDYTGGHTMGSAEKRHVMEWFIYGVTP